LFIRTLPETIASAPGQREHERQDSDNTHDLIFPQIVPHGASVPNKKPQAFSRCGSPGSQMYGYEITPPR
jgi:hypothetical protein